MSEHTPGPCPHCGSPLVQGAGGFRYFCGTTNVCMGTLPTWACGRISRLRTANEIMLAALEAVEPILRKNLYPYPDKPNSDWAKYKQLAAAIKAAKGE